MARARARAGELLRSSLARNLFFATVSAGTNGFLLVLVIIAGRRLGDERYGQFAFALAVATIFETVMDFGLKEVTIREVARDPSAAARLLGNTFALKLALGGAAMLVTIVGTPFLRSEPDVRWAVYLLCASSALRSYLLTVRAVLTGLERFRAESAIAMADRASLLVCGAAVLLTGFGVIGLSLAFVLSRAAILALTWILARRYVTPFHLEFDLAFWRDLQRRAAPFGSYLLVFALYNYLDTVLLGVLRSDAETGLYNAAYRIYEAFILVASIIGTVLTPRLSRYILSDPEEHRRLAAVGIRGAMLAALPISIAGFIFAPQVVTLLFGSDYQASATALRILVTGFLVVFPISVYQAIAISMHAEHLLLATAVIGLVLNVALNVALIPRYGMYAAAFVTVVCEMISLALLAWGIARRRAGAAVTVR